MPPELSRPLVLAHVPAAGRQLRIEADTGECTALAARFGIPAVESLVAELHLMPEAGGAVRVQGRLRAAVTQNCVVTVEPVAQQVDQPLALRLLPAGQVADEAPDEPDEIEAEGEAIDLGEVVAEQLALALDPYPRAPGAEMPDAARDPEASPFAALRSLRTRQ